MKPELTTLILLDGPLIEFPTMEGPLNEEPGILQLRFSKAEFLWEAGLSWLVKFWGVVDPDVATAKALVASVLLIRLRDKRLEVTTAPAKMFVGIFLFWVSINFSFSLLMLLLPVVLLFKFIRKLPFNMPEYLLTRLAANDGDKARASLFKLSLFELDFSCESFQHFIKWKKLFFIGNQQISLFF